MKVLNTILLLIILMGLGVGGWYMISQQKIETARIERNLKALKDSITVSDNLVGEKMSEISALETNIRELRLLNSDLYKEVKKIRGDVETIQQIGMVVESVDTLYSRDSIIIIKTDTINKNYNFMSDWNFSDSVWSLSGKTYFDLRDSTTESFLTRRKISLSLYTGIYTEGKQKKIFVRSDNPDIDIVSLQGASLGSTKKKFRETFFIGPSISTGIDYMGNPNVVFGISFGFNLLSLRKK